MPANTRAVTALAVLMAVTFGVAAFAAQFHPGVWYANLHKPDWTPPDGVFAPVWTLLYGLMAVAAWRVWRVRGWRNGALLLYGVQLLLNGVWSWLFFGLHHIALAAVELAVLWLLILVTTAAFWRCSRLAGALLLPYAAWVGFAAVLNAAIWQLHG